MMVVNRIICEERNMDVCTDEQMGISHSLRVMEICTKMEIHYIVATLQSGPKWWNEIRQINQHCPRAALQVWFKKQLGGKVPQYV